MVIYVSILERISKPSVSKSKNILEKLQYTGAFAAITIGIFWIFEA
jgi:hypothetical protein